MHDAAGATRAQAQIHERELELVQPDVRRSSERMAELLAEDFVEFSSSGVVYTKRQVLEALEHEGLEEPPVRRAIAHHEVVMLSDTVALTRYRVVRSGRPGETQTQSLRSSVWRLEDGRWRMIFHQGTLVPAA